MLDRQPVLQCERVLLRPLRADDWDALFAVASDPLIWAQHPAHDRWREPVFCGFFDDAMAGGGALVVIGRGSGAVIGSSRFQGLDEGNGGSVGAALTDRREERIMAGGAMIPHLTYAITRTDFAAGPLTG